MTAVLSPPLPMPHPDARDARDRRDAATPPACSHPEAWLHWFAPRLLPGTADGRDPRGRHAAQGGYCRRCRTPMLRTADVAPWGPAQPVTDAGPLPPVARAERRAAG